MLDFCGEHSIADVEVIPVQGQHEAYRAAASPT